MFWPGSTGRDLQCVNDQSSIIFLTELRKGLCFFVGRFVKFSCCNVSGQCNKWSIPQSMTEKKLCFRGFFLCWSLKVVFSGSCLLWKRIFHAHTKKKQQGKKRMQNYNTGGQDRYWLIDFARGFSILTMLQCAR